MSASVQSSQRKKPRSPEPQPVETGEPPPLHALDRVNVEVMPREMLAEAEYNPRVINDDQRARLRAILSKHGLVEPIVFNKRTGRIIGGHRRIAILDAIHGSPRYSVHVNVLDVSEIDERELNIALNNDAAQGQYDLEALLKLYSDKEFPLEVAATGFSIANMYQLFGDDPTNRDTVALDDLAQKIQKARDELAIAGRSARDKKDRPIDSMNFYLVVVFASYDHRKRFTDAAKLADNRYQDGREIARRCGLDIDAEPAAE